MASLMPNGKQQYFNSNGGLLSGGKVYTYAAGTSTPKATYSDAAGTIPNLNPVPLDARGEALIYWSGNYKVDVQDASGVSLSGYPVDNYAAVASSVDLSGSNGASLVGYGASTLDAILKNSLGKVVTSITNLRGIDKTKYNQAFAVGYYASGDGGGGAYWYDSTDTTSTDNGGTIIVASDGGRWKLAYTGAVSIRQFGAQPNGTNSSPFVQAMINAGIERIYAPTGSYTFNTTLNFTNLPKPLVMSGDGTSYNNTQGTTFLFKTGGWMADMTGCQWLHLEHMQWVSDGTAGFSTMGVLYARSTTVGFAMYNTMFKMGIFLPSSTGSSVGSIALANNCAENFQCDQCWFLADCPLASTLGNDLNFVSTYTTLANTTFSNTDQSYRQCIFQARNYYSMVLYGLVDSTFDQCNWDLLGALGASVQAGWAISSSTLGYKDCGNIRFTGDHEGFPALAYLTGNTFNLDINMSATPSVGLKPFTNTVHDGLRMRMAGSGANLMAATGAGVIVKNGIFVLNNGQTLVDATTELRGGNVFGGGVDLTDITKLNLSAASSYIGSCVNSRLKGSATWTPGVIASNRAVNQAVSVPGANFNSSVTVLPPYTLSGCEVTGYVDSVGVVQISLYNPSSASSGSFGAGTWRVIVENFA